MASEIRFRPALAALTAFLVGCAVFVYDRVHDLVAYVGHSLFAIEWRPSVDDVLRLNAIGARFSMSSMRLPNWSAFKAFIERARPHRESFGDGFLPEYAG